MSKRSLLAIFYILTAVFQLSAQKTYVPETVPNVQLQDARRFVSNPDGLLSQPVADRIDTMCFGLKERGIAQVVVLMLDSVDPADLDLFAHRVLNLWGVGEKGRDNGLVISVVKQQRDIQFETGYGLEGVLPDALCKRIQTTYMVPYLKGGNWDEGVLEGVTAVYNVLMGNEGELSALDAEAGEKSELWVLAAFVLMFLLPVIVIAVAYIIYVRKRNKCPLCQAPNGLKLINSRVVKRTWKSETVEKTFRCKKCGHIVKRRNTYSRGAGKIIGGGGGSGGWSGGSSGGGGFGGGMSGGGGARSGF